MRKKVIYLLGILALCSCSNDVLEPQKDQKDISTELGASAGSIVPGTVRVKFTPTVGNDLAIVKTRSGEITSGYAKFDKFLSEIKATSMERVFPYAGQYEERTRKEGMHLWYDIHFDPNTPVTRAAGEVKNIPGVAVVEEVYREAYPDVMVHYADNVPTTKADGSKFSDPSLPLQWHYKNTAAYPRAIAGADINLFEAWKIETGKPNVIVAIVDGGIDVTHEDLKDNLRVNQAELNGVAGVDDDGNGYIDDIYGFNFVRRTGKVVPDSEGHGTHVSGTVAARNNNGVGVCGVAGGDGTPNSGVRMISCQIFEGASGGGNSADAIKYGADNGAVISQNSWGYVYPGPGQIPESIKVAIDYFIKYAGCDNKGNQRPDSPMKGGVVMFAAGNDSQDYLAYPGAYPPCVSVSAMAPDFKMAYYTNRGDWVSIMAPGGDYHYPRGEVYSTMPMNMKKYGYMQGTSMACPHVSGVAALIVSKFGRQGFTNDMLKKRLLSSLRPWDINKMNPGYEGRLGIGYIDAAKALATNNNKPPKAVAMPSVTAGYVSMDISWKAVADEDDGTAQTYVLYYSDSERLTAKNYKSAMKSNINGAIYKPGDVITYSKKSLALKTTYYFAMVAEDRWGLTSAPVFFEATTKENHAPILKRLDEAVVRITGTETATVRVSMKEPDGQEMEMVVSGQKTGVTYTVKDDIITFVFKAMNPVGKYTTSVTVTDPFGAVAKLDIPFEIYENHPPKLVKEFGNIFKPKGKVLDINLSDYFKDEDNHKMVFTAKSTDPSVANVKLVDNKLTITTYQIGLVSIRLTATDTQDASSSATVNLNVCQDALVYTAYPVPTKDDLHIRLSDDITGEAVINIYTTVGQKVYTKTINPMPENRMVDLDLRKLSGGAYVLNVVSGGKSFNQTIVKL